MREKKLHCQRRLGAPQRPWWLSRFGALRSHAISLIIVCMSFICFEKFWNCDRLSSKDSIFVLSAESIAARGSTHGVSGGARMGCSSS